MLLLIAAFALPLLGQAPLDPARGVAPAPPTNHTPLPEEYLWTANDVTAQRADRSKYSWSRQDLRVDPHFFRASFDVSSVPAAATLYVAGPRSAKVWINGRLAGNFNSDPSSPIGFHVFHADAGPYLKAGANSVVISAVRGRGIVSGAGANSTQQITYGEVMVAKIVPAAYGVEAKPLVYTSPAWKSSATVSAGWESPAFDDTKWLPAQSLGPIEDDPDLRQWSADAGMYEWPGYIGMTAAQRTMTLEPAAITHVYPGLADLTIDKPADEILVAGFSSQTDLESPALLVDFGRELAGQLLIQSTAACEATVSVAYGESELEALATGLTSDQRGGNYLGTNLLHVPPNGISRGPKSAFRYARLRILRGCPTMSFKLRAESIYYPVDYAGSFESSDPVLNKIWETGAYTAHLCMQDSIWDAPKRDRGRWAGDLDIEGRVISTAFGDASALEDTLNRLAALTGPTQHVNGIAGYSALWLTTLESLYLHSGDQAYLATQRGHILQLLARMDKDIDPTTNLLPASSKGWGFVDWAPGLYGQTNETRIGTNLHYLRGFAAGAYMLRALNDPAAAAYAARVDLLTQAAKKAYASQLGTNWQLNALASLTMGDADRMRALEIKQDSPSDPVISPYFNAYLIDALSAAGLQQKALEWIRNYWGGMLAEGATSFWESYDLRWPKTNFHLSLAADGTNGYFVSLAHGWSSGPTAWLSENVLGVVPTGPGYSTVSINPTLLGLKFAKGTIPTPHGPISVSIDAAGGVAIDLPAGVTATLPGREPGKRVGPGHFTFAH